MAKKRQKEPTYEEMLAIKTIAKNLKVITENGAVEGLEFAMFAVDDCGGRHHPYVHLIVHGVKQEKLQPLICAANSYRAVDCHTIFGTIYKLPMSIERLMQFVTLCNDNEYFDRRVNKRVRFGVKN